MKTGMIVRLVALVVLSAGMFGWPARISAADPTGDSPANGLPIGSSMTETCVSQTLAPGAQVWFKVQYDAGTDLEMYSKNATGVNFDVYDPSQVTNFPTLSPQPIGRLTPNKNEPNYTNSWQGHLAQGNVSDFYYVLLTNTNTFSITFSFCTRETPKFTPPAMSPICPPLKIFITAPVRSTSPEFGPRIIIINGCPYLLPAPP